MGLRRAAHALLVAGLALFPACRKAEGPKGGPGKPLRIAFVPKGTTHEFWRTMHAGAVKGQRDLVTKGIHVDLVWKGPLREDDREQQVQVVESFASQGMDGIVLAPLDAKALVRPVEEAKRLGVPTVIVDSALGSDQVVSFVATDNVKGGEMAADELGRLLGGKGRVLLLRYQEGSASTTAREEGFLARLKAGWPGLELVLSDQYAGPTVDTARAGLREPAEPETLIPLSAEATREYFRWAEGKDLSSFLFGVPLPYLNDYLPWFIDFSPDMQLLNTWWLRQEFSSSRPLTRSPVSCGDDGLVRFSPAGLINYSAFCAADSGEYRPRLQGALAFGRAGCRVSNCSPRAYAQNAGGGLESNPPLGVLHHRDACGSACRRPGHNQSE